MAGVRRTMVGVLSSDNPDAPLLWEWVLSRSSPAERRLSALQPRRLACSRLAHRCAQLRATHSNLKPAERRRSAADSAAGHTLM